MATLLRTRNPRTVLPPITDPVVEDWGTGWQDRWWVQPETAYMDKVRAQGLRVAANVEVVTGTDGIRRMRVHNRPTTQPYTVETTTIPTGGWSAGIIQHEATACHRRFGRWTFDFVATPGRGGRTVALLWPSDPAAPWPASGELDAPEIGDEYSAHRLISPHANHYARADGSHGQSITRTYADHTKPIRVSLICRPGVTEVEYDGRIVSRFTSNLHPGAMKLCFQTAVSHADPTTPWSGTFTDDTGATVQRQPSYLEVGPIHFVALAY